MTQYIDKSALVAEIESKFQRYWKLGEESDALQDGNAKYWGGVLSCLNEVKTLIDTLEVKEVDFEKMWKKYFKYRGDMATVNVKHIAKHFFELGMQAKEGNTLAKAKGFLVRDKDDYTAIYSTKPNRGKTEWVDGNHPRNANESSCLFTMDARLLPNVEFDDEPVEVEVTITKKGE